ncbi:hypothetical protein B1218_38330, partial [Pseudomonas ogarae]
GVVAGAVGAAGAVLVVAGSHCRVWEGGVAAFVSGRGVGRVVGDQAVDDAGGGLCGCFVVDGDPAAVGGGGRLTGGGGAGGGRWRGVGHALGPLGVELGNAGGGQRRVGGGTVRRALSATTT